MHSPKHTDIHNVLSDQEKKKNYVQIKILDVILFKVCIVQNTQIHIHYV